MFLIESSIISGLVSGLIYALSGIGLILIYRVSGYVSFAQGDIAAVGLYLGYFLHQGGMPYLVVAAVVIVVAAILGGVIGACIAIPLERFGILPAAIATIGVHLILSGLNTVFFRADARAFPAAGTGSAFTIGSVTLSVADAVSFIVCALLVILLTVGFKRTRAGVAMRAVHENEKAAKLLGIRGIRLKRLAWVGAGALAGVVGLFIAPIYALTPTSINSLLVFGFAAIVIGGFDSIGGAVVAGVLIGIVTNLTAAFISPDLVTFLLFVMLLVVLLVRPNGLFGRRPVSRV